MWSVALTSLPRWASAASGRVQAPMLAARPSPAGAFLGNGAVRRWLSSDGAPNLKEKVKAATTTKAKPKTKSKAKAAAAEAEAEAAASGEEAVGGGNAAAAWPPSLLILPLHNKPVYPHTRWSIFIKDQSLITYLRDNEVKYFGFALTNSALDTPEFGSMTIRNETVTLQEMHKIGVLAKIDWPTNVPDYTIERTPGFEDGFLKLTFVGLRRIRIGNKAKNLGENAPEHLQTARVKYLSDKPYDDTDVTVRTYVNEMKRTVAQIMKGSVHMKPYNEELARHFLDKADSRTPSIIADFGCLLSHARPKDQQEVFEELDVPERLRKVLDLLKKDIAVIELQQSLSSRLEESVVKNQRQYILNESLKNIKKELGMGGKEDVTGRFTDRLLNKVVPEAAMKVINDEMTKLSTLDPASSEFNLTRNYLDWLTQLPWGVYKPEQLSVTEGMKILDQDHFGLEDVKERIIELIAVGQLRGSMQGKIICLVGPPGTGKTSIGRSIARALTRDFVRFSVGGLTDVAEIKGHRRTYVGAMPGKLIQLLKRCDSANPVVLIDEIDKLGKGYQGDPASALLEVLDPEQNPSYVDHYLDVPFDLSKVLFVCTANITDTIPEPLLDRMEVIRLSGYVLEEKLAIAKQYLIPSAIKDTGLEGAQVTITDDAITDLVRWHCRESGVRSLQQMCEKTLRKAARKIVDELTSNNVTFDQRTDRTVFPGEHTPVVVDHGNLESFVGKRKYTSDRFYMTTPPGVAMGLAWTAMGGATFYIETSTSGESGERGELRCTGQLGDVMKESTEIALAVAKHYYMEHFPKKDKDEKNVFEKYRIHMHIPEGATPKDGPSAGSAMTTALLSLATGMKVKDNLAMTGEITLTGKILAIGGVKEKIIAAKRSGVTHVIIPEGNRKDFDELAAHLKEGIEVDFVSTYADVFHKALEAVPVADSAPAVTPDTHSSQPSPV